MTNNWHLEFLSKQELRKDMRRILFDWTADPFCAAHLGLSWRSKTDHLLIRSEGRLACHVGLLRDSLLVGELPIQVGGIGDVITLPEFRGRGLAQAAIRKALEIIWNDWDLVYAMLFCLPPVLSFYERMCWKAIDAPVWISQPSGKIQMPTATMFKSRRGEPWPSGQVELRGTPW